MLLILSTVANLNLNSLKILTAEISMMRRIELTVTKYLMW
jgi:hypothetical protein